MEVKRDEGINIGENPFYQTNNSNYGSQWQASAGLDPVKLEQIPLYSDVGDRDLALKNSMKTYKHEALKVMRENQELDVVHYPAIKHNMAQLKLPEAQEKNFPAQNASAIVYPEQALKKNLLYQTSNMGYGAKIPNQQDLPNKFFPRPENFTATFNGGNYIDTGLNTFKTPSRIHREMDQ